MAAIVHLRSQHTQDFFCNHNYDYYILFYLDQINVLSRAINFGRQCHFKIWLDYHKFKKIPCLIMLMSKK
jgi:hypothetical protein